MIDPTYCVGCYEYALVLGGEHNNSRRYYQADGSYSGTTPVSSPRPTGVKD